MNDSVIPPDPHPRTVRLRQSPDMLHRLRCVHDGLLQHLRGRQLMLNRYESRTSGFSSLPIQGDEGFITFDRASPEEDKIVLAAVMTSSWSRSTIKSLLPDGQAEAATCTSS